MPENDLSFNYDKLVGRIIEKCKTRQNFAQKINMSIPTLIGKLDGSVDFKSKEIFKICEVLEIPMQEISIFFYQTS